MTKTKILDGLVTHLPAAFAQMPLLPTRCILATRTGQAVLARFGLASEPWPVRLAAANAEYVRLMREEQTVAEATARGAWCVWVGCRPNDAETSEGGWNGHLILRVPALDCCVDLDLQGASRPRKKLALPPALRIPWMPGQEGVAATREDGVVIQYEYAPELTGYLQAVDWTTDPEVRWPGLVTAVEQAIRRGGTLVLRRQEWR